MAKEKFERNEAPRERRDDRSHRPRQDDADGGDREGSVEEERLAKAIKYADIAKGGIVRDETKTVTIAVSARGVRDRRSATTRTSIAPATPTTSRT